MSKSGVRKSGALSQIWPTACSGKESFIGTQPDRSLRLRIVYGCFPTTMAKLNSYDTDSMLHKT